MSAVNLRFDHYTKSARQAVTAAERFAIERGHSEVEPLHLLFKIVEEQKVAQEAIGRAGVNPNDVLVETENELRRIRARRAGRVAYLSPRMNDLIGRAEGESAREKGKRVSISHLLIACSQEAGPVRMALRRCGLNAPVLRATLAGSTATDEQESPGKSSSRSTPESSDGDPIEDYGIDWTRKAAQGQFDPVVGRDSELRRIMQILARRRENNPLLVGERGIGKRTILKRWPCASPTGTSPAC